MLSDEAGSLGSAGSVGVLADEEGSFASYIFGSVFCTLFEELVLSLQLTRATRPMRINNM